MAVMLAAGPELVVKNRLLERGATLGGLLLETGLEENTATAVLGALRAAQLDVRRVRAGDQLRLVWRAGELERVDLRRSFLEEWNVRRDQDRYVGKRREVDREQRVELVSLTVERSVWDAALAAGESPDVAVALSDVFAWDIDFYREVQPGDQMRALVEKIYARGRLVGYGAVLAATYEGRSLGKKETYRYTLPDGTASYFARDGASAKRTFLKSPLKFVRVTSRFGGRFHPILNQFGAHNGVDFAAVVGTPVQAVSDGVVTRAGWGGNAGNRVCVRHSNGFESCYFHLSRVQVREGQRVAQKTIVGESGNTGLSTGPHLHYGLMRGGRWVNPMNQNFPKGDPLPQGLLADFTERTSDWVRRLEAGQVAAAPAVGASP